MLGRAEASPQDMPLLKVSLDMEVSLLLRKAEQRNNIDLYFSCMCLSLPILAVSNAKNYVHIFTELLKYWKTCSKCEKNLIAQYGFVLETSNGVLAGIDYGHEKYVRLVRDTTGKIYRAPEAWPGSSTQRCAECTSKRNRASKTVKHSRDAI